ncbi:hypothetical protein [Ensifer adhaerens]
MSLETQSMITFIVIVSMEGPIEPGRYQVGDVSIEVAYPKTINIGMPSPLVLPSGASTQFIVNWKDKRGQTATQLNQNSFERYVPLQRALLAINNMIEAFKLVRVGHADGLKLRSVGAADTLLWTVLVDGAPIGMLNMSLKLDPGLYPWAVQHTMHDIHGTTSLARPHIDSATYPLARRYLRCFDLCERGYHSEALIVAHSILDDLTQVSIDNLLHSKGLSDEEARSLLLRGIKERRLKIYLGPLLTILYGKDVDALWKDASAAITWLNKVRNKIAHSGEKCTRDEAYWAIYASLKTAAVLAHFGIAKAEFPPGMFREARIKASWTLGRPNWAPTEAEIETDPFDPHCLPLVNS